jgi:hypothetical protein
MAGSKDCTMSFKKWQKLAAIRIGNTASALIFTAVCTVPTSVSMNISDAPEWRRLKLDLRAFETDGCCARQAIDREQFLGIARITLAMSLGAEVWLSVPALAAYWWPRVLASQRRLLRSPVTAHPLNQYGGAAFIRK